MQYTIDETNRRRIVQEEFNERHGITPTSIISNIKDIMETVYEKDYVTVALEAAEAEKIYHNLGDLKKDMKRLEKEMNKAAKTLAFEEAAVLRDRLKELKELELQWL
jgi:excinuclease ABC subunit B